jgi:hypothetical protein
MGAAYVRQNSSQPIQLDTNSYKDQIHSYYLNRSGKYNPVVVATDGKDSTYNGAFTDEQKVVDALNDFNNKYTTYVRCNNNNNNNACSSRDKAIGTVTDAGNILLGVGTSTGLLKNLTKDIGNMKPVDRATYDASYNYLLNTHNDITKLRSELDSKLKELYEIPGSFVVDSKYEYDATMYSGIIFTILATSMLYFTFTRL